MGNRGMRIPEVTENSGVCRTKIYQEIAAGHLKARKIGRVTIVLNSDYEEWLNGLPTIHD